MTSVAQDICTVAVFYGFFHLVLGLLFGQAPEWVLEYWHPSEKAMYPDYFAKREKWKKLQLESWDKEVSTA